MTRIRALAAPALAAAVVLAAASDSQAGGPFRRRPRAVTETVATRPDNANAPSPMLGTFYPTPYAILGGAYPTASGYSPLGQYGVNPMAMYGPTSVYRSVTAPVSVYSRGYDGQVYGSRGHSFSSPYLPASNPVTYPTPNSYYYRPRGVTTPPNWTTGIGWVDQN